MLVGLGPGSLGHLTARAREAIAEADTVIGYATYIRLVADLLAGKEVVRKSMTEELDRAIEALERARQGRKVAIVSSGDAGVYGMAGPTFEVLFQAGWTPESAIEVEIVPGASALNTCAGPRRRATDARLLRHLAVRPADPMAEHRPPARCRRLRRFRRRAVQPEERAAHPADRRGATHLPAPSRRADAGGHRQVGLSPEAAHRIHHPGKNVRSRYRHADHGADRQFEHLSFATA
jgi:precorrin-6B methylase 1